jgi:hypothetical protein
MVVKEANEELTMHGGAGIRCKPLKDSAEKLESKLHEWTSAIRQLTGVRNLRARDRPYLLGRHRHDRRRLAGERDELDFVSLPARVNVNNCSDVAAFERLVGKRSGQNDPIMFLNHAGNILAGVCCDESWFLGSAVDDPDRSNLRRAPVRAVDWPLDSVLRAIAGFRHGRDGVSAGVGQECLRQELPLVPRETKVREKLCFPGPFGMLGSQEVIDNLSPFDIG